jgi:hypothetical protein
LFNERINGASNSWVIGLPSFVPGNAKSVKLSAVSIDGDSDVICGSNFPVETTIGGFATDGTFQKYYVYNTPKVGSGSYSGTGWNIELPIVDRNIYIVKPNACPNSTSGGMNLLIYLDGYI